PPAPPLPAFVAHTPPPLVTQRLQSYVAVQKPVDPASSSAERPPCPAPQRNRSLQLEQGI
ncbi:MAG TPA: hypothetical protein VJR89_31130, partial [Polyangiales bacterium]|nr:hypothetical protein [Polyangiales bacterium]